MSAQVAIRWSGIAAIVAAILIPFESLGRLFSDAYLPMYITVANVGYVFLIFALTGIGRILVDETGTPGFIVVITGTAGAVLLIADGVVSAYVYPALDKETVIVLQRSPGLALVSVLGPLALLAATSLLAATAGRAERLPGRAAMSILAGVLLTTLARALASLPLSDSFVAAGSLVFAVGLAWMGVALRTPGPPS